MAADGGQLDGLEGWVADLRAQEAARARVRQRWLAAQVAEARSLADVVHDLARSRSPVVVTTRGGEQLTGRLVDRGADFLAMSGPGLTLVSMRGVSSVTELGDDELGTDDPERDLAGLPEGVVIHADSTLLDVLGQASGHRPRVRIQAGSLVLAVGELRLAGPDLVAVRPDFPPGRLTYVPIPSPSDPTVSFLDSG